MTIRRWLSLVLSLVMLAGLAVPAMAKDKDAYTTLYGSEITSLNYLIISAENEYTISANVIDTLVEYDNFGQVQPSLATSWEVSEDGLVWTFHLRQDAKWVDASLKEYAPVVAQDFVTAAQYILNAQNASGTASTMYNAIAGAKDYYLGTATPAEGAEAALVMEWDTVGVKALDEYTLQYTLSSPIPYFLSMVTYVTFMPVNADFLAEKGDQFGLATGNDTILYCGAYVLSEFKPQERRVYLKNTTNWDADKVYIEKIESIYNKESGTISPELYLRGEVDAASIDSTIATEWLADPAKADLIHPLRQTSSYSYFYTFNFNPTFDAIYEPENWKLAVNNENFRLSIAAGFDRVKAKSVVDPDNAKDMLCYTITPNTFAVLNGVDYVNMGDLAEITALGAGAFNKEAALAYKEAAVKELTEAGATFPIKVLFLYNPSSSSNNSAEEGQIFKQQIEGLLGTDYIDIVLEPGPSTSYLSCRRNGSYGIMNCNWGPDYADPETFTDPFRIGGNYNFFDLGNSYYNEDGTNEYYLLVEAAKAETSDMQARYLAFAKAEAFLINKGIVIPFGRGTGGYTASRLDPFSSPIAPFGLSNMRYKGQYLLDKPLSTDAYYDALDAYEEARDALIK